jgi:nitroimidazol reductase NimA-like FMN-containing flavoprotein (pyridoxamine 5'-phosphate oxidase superfamily)
MASTHEKKSGGSPTERHTSSPASESCLSGSKGFSLSPQLDHGEAPQSRRDPGTLEKEIRGLFERQKLGVLATQCSGAPYGNLVAFASSRDISWLLFVTSRSTRKYENIAADARVALVIDNRSNELRDFGDAIAVTALGRAVEIEAKEKNTLLRTYLEKHPNLNGFAKSPSCALFKVDVEKYIIVSRFQNVMELWPNK